jgi:hypothetical protein
MGYKVGHNGKFVSSGDTVVIQKYMGILNLCLPSYKELIFCFNPAHASGVYGDRQINQEKLNFKSKLRGLPTNKKQNIFVI